MKPSSELDNLAKLLAKLPGLGPRSSKRIMLQLLKKRETLMLPLIKSLSETAEKITTCPLCGNFDTSSPCSICTDPKRDSSIICVVHDVADLWALERCSFFRGKYFVLGGMLSALDGIGPQDLGIEKLASRISHEKISEVIFALPATVDGQTTIHYIAERLKNINCKVSGLAHGLPIGGELDYMDEGTIEAAIKARHFF